jgi:hypothetical protein
LLTAIAYDSAGNDTWYDVNVTVSNDTAPPTVELTKPSAGGVLGGIVVVEATASDDLEVFGVQFTVDGVPLNGERTVAPYAATWSTATAANGPHTIAAIARDAAGHTATTSVVVTVANDVTAPVVALETPAAGVSIGGLVAVLAAASDEVGVIGVQFQVDAEPIADVDTTAPYEALWNTADFANGTHTVTAVARDGAGHETTTSAEVTVLNDTSAPAGTNQSHPRYSGFYGRGPTGRRQ